MMLMETKNHEKVLKFKYQKKIIINLADTMSITL